MDAIERILTDLSNRLLSVQLPETPLSHISTLDAALLAVVIVSVCVGLIQGLLRQVSGVLVLYLATVLAAQYQGLAGQAIGAFIPNINYVLASMYGLVLVFLAANAGLHWLSYQVYPSTRLPSYQFFDRVGGGAVGLVWGWLIAGVAMTILAYLSALPWGMTDSVWRDVNTVIGRSQFAPSLQTSLRWFAMSLRPWLPGG